MAVGSGDGTTIAFGTSGFAAELLSVNGPNPTRAALPSTHLGTTSWKTFIAAALVDPGDISITIQYDPTVSIPISAVEETITVDPAGSGSTLSFTGFLTSAGHSFEVEAMMQADISIQITGAITGI